MKKNKPGFKDFQLKLDNKTKGKSKNEHLIFAEKSLGSRLYQRYECLFEWLFSSRNLSTDLSWYSRLSYEERQVCRTILLKHAYSSVGVHFDYKLAVRETVEHILQHHNSQQQDDVSENTSRQQPRDSSSYSLSRLREYIFYDIETSGTSQASRSRPEPIRDRWYTRTWSISSE